MLTIGIILGLVLGLLLGGKLEHLATIRLRFLPLLFLAVIIRFATELALGWNIPLVETLRAPLLGSAYGLLLFTLWHNRWYPGLALAFVGVAANALAITANGGRMPVWLPAFEASGLTPPLDSVLHFTLPAQIGPEFLFRLGPLGDIIPIPFPPIQNVASLGDVFLTAGLGFFLFATLLRRPEQAQQAVDDARAGRYEGLAGTLRLPGTLAPVDEEGNAVRAGSGLNSAFDEALALERPLMMGAGGIGLASPALAPFPLEEAEARAVELTSRGQHAAAVVRENTIAPGDLVRLGVPGLPSLAERVRSHPYVRLALNPSFSALWVGQIISLFGDRVNQIALAAFVYELTDSALLTALMFFVATVPNLFLSPIAGTFVDRWDQKQVLVVSDILRAAVVLLVPVAILLNVWVAYPLVFLLTTISIFFRPARQAILPRIVDEEDLLSANSAMWVAETIADVINYPLAGLFVVFLRDSLALAFWFDSVTYLASAGLIATIVVPPLIRRAAAAARPGDAETAGETAGETPRTDEGRTSVGEDLRAGWGFLRNETVLLANTLQGAAGQFSLGMLLVATVILAREITTAPEPAWRATYAFMETAIGAGSLIGGFLLGAVAGRARKGRLIIVAYIAFGVGGVALGLVGNVTAVLGILFGMGVANMAFVIPSQTLFQERTPPELMGRVVSFRFALVFGGMSLAMAAGGVLVELFTAAPVIIGAGVISIAAGVGGTFVRAVRDA